jgi:hypothetical protein
MTARRVSKSRSTLRRAEPARRESHEALAHGVVKE